MKSLVAGIWFVLSASLQAAEPVMVPDARSPGEVFAIRLTHDRPKDSSEAVFSAPDVEIVATGSKKVLASFAYPADPNADHQPLRTNIRVHWNADGSAVALCFSERFYTHLLVWRLRGTFEAPEAFEAVTLPDTRPVIQAMIPRFKEFRSRWHSQFQSWPTRNTIQFSSGTGALIAPLRDGEDPNFMAVYSFTVDINDPKTPVIKRVQLVTEDEDEDAGI
jgi:hypothetical protein